VTLTGLFLILIVSVVVAVGAMLLVRSRAPVGGFFTDSDRAAGIFGVTGTGFAVFLAFVIFLSFESYDRARESASIEAVATTELFRIVQLYPDEPRVQLHGQLVCYARSVINHEWEAMREQRESPVVQSWIVGLERTIEGIEIRNQKQGIAYGQWFDRASERREGRRGRLAEAFPYVPSVVWAALILGGLLLLIYVCFFADRGERWFVQALMMATVTAMVVTGLLLVRFLDRPYQRSGGIKPRAMRTTLAIMERESERLGPQGSIPCDESGTRVARL
jgi:hypothetical protein